MIRQRKKMAMKKNGGRIAMKSKGGSIAMKSKGGRIAMKKKGGKIALKNGGVAMTVAAAKKLLKQKGFTVTKTKKKK